jgi:hypothetical protein
MRGPYVVSLILLAGASGFAAAASTIRPDHPYLGRWTWVYRGCTETYLHRADATTSVTSGEEISESAYTVTDQPEASGFYRVADTVTRSNGKTGCDGEPNGTPVGDEDVRFIFIRPSGEEMLVCGTASLDHCYGPLRRIDSPGTPK